VWWRMLSRVRRGVGMGVGGWFDNNVRKVVGGGRSTFFWTDNWVGGIPLWDRFPRLFSLAEDRWATVAEMEGRGWTVGGGVWVCRRRLFAWEEESVVECATFLHNIVLQDNIYDRWRWLLDPIHGYTVKGTYHFLTSMVTPADRSLYVDVWHK